MSLAGLFAHETLHADRTVLRLPGQSITWGELAAAVQQRHRELLGLAGHRVGLMLTADLFGISTLVALEQLECNVFLLDALLAAERREAWTRQLRLSATLTSQFPTGTPIAGAPIAGDNAAGPDGAVTILTSGTTGEPKAVRHSWQSLARPVRIQTDNTPPCWLLAYRPHLYAGLQVIWQALLNHGTLVAPPPDAEPTLIVDMMLAGDVRFASGTPSYWRRLLISADPARMRQVPLKQVTLGGEVVDQALLDRLHALFPLARLAHIYATTELGRCFSVTDGRAGFPRSFLDHPSSDGVELQIREGQLWVRSANAMCEYDPCAPAPSRRMDSAGWFPTGDAVEVHEDRVYFVGRNTDMINVGGNKVFPVAVERVIRQLPAVADVRVFGQDSSLAGQLVACEIVPAAGQLADDVRQRVREHCQAHLDRYQCPRLIEIVDRLRLTDAGKLAR